MNNAKTYYEVVFEGKDDTICGMLEGFLLGADKEWDWFLSRDSDIEAETFTEAFLEWASLRSKLHHVIIEKDFLNALKESTKKHADMKYIDSKYIRSAKIIKKASFDFEAKTFAKKYALEIKEILKELPEDLKIKDFNEKENVIESAKGIELYTPEHDYEYISSGNISGEIQKIIELRNKLNDHPLVEVTDIKLYFE